MPNSSRSSSPSNPRTSDRTNAPQQQEKTRGSGHSEQESNPSAAPKPGSEASRANHPGAPVGEVKNSQAKIQAHGQDADDQLASGKTPPGGTNLAGGKSNAPDRR